LFSRHAPHAVPAPPSAGKAIDASHGPVLAEASSEACPGGAEELDELHAKATEAAVMLTAAQTHG